MSPQLVQSIKLLQLSHAELAAYVEAELEAQSRYLTGEGSPRPMPPCRVSPDFLTAAKQKAEAAGPRTVPGPPPSRGDSAPGDHPDRRPMRGTVRLKPEMGDILAQATSLTEHLEAQLDLATADPKFRMIGENLIHTLNEAGYFTDDLAEFRGPASGRARGGRGRAAAHPDLRAVGRRRRAIYPECLEHPAARARPARSGDAGPSRPSPSRRPPRISRRRERVCGVDQEDLADMLAEIRRLEPKPGSSRLPPSSCSCPTFWCGPGRMAASTSSSIRKPFPASCSIGPITRKSRRWCARSRTRASSPIACRPRSWLTRSLDQRAKTILKVAAEIVRQQEAFFRQGVAALRPMTLKSVAEAIGMHESTISRVAANKAIGTERGTHPMKFFFAPPPGRASIPPRPSVTESVS